MSTNRAGERLQDRQDVILLLRLLVDRQGRVIQGEVGSVEDDQDVARWVRFRGPDGLLGAVQACVASGLTG
jgi:Na+-translocating ferredoxin:NAD+ oxidoreductase RnfG subunit